MQETFGQHPNERCTVQETFGQHPNERCTVQETFGQHPNERVHSKMSLFRMTTTDLKSQFSTATSVHSSSFVTENISSL
jgi:hypothetical protein